MPQQIELRLPPEIAANDALLREAVARHLDVDVSRITAVQKLRQSLDARKKAITFQLKLSVFIDEPFRDAFAFEPRLKDVRNRKPVWIAGAGPAGLFAAIRLIELGYRPCIIERGKDVRARRRDLAAINKDGVVPPDSNYCFGEGGAGTYSDGKLYTRASKRGSVQRCLQWFHYFGADSRILYEAHPHIGTNKLPAIIVRMREAILESGGEILFEHKLTDLEIADNRLKGLILNNKLHVAADTLILATGHSARDIFELLARRNIHIESKPFALGVRVEHPQALIDAARYHCSLAEGRNDLLPPAAYRLVSQAAGRGVFSFCMCPGGIIAPASTSEGELVVNGWSPSKRNNAHANSGIVVTVGPDDFRKSGFDGPLAGMRYQQTIEQKAWRAGGGSLVAPAQRLTDFCHNKRSANLPDSSYLPGLNSALLHQVLPPEINQPLVQGFFHFGKLMKGFLTDQAVVVATESRTSSPVRIPRDKVRLEHPQIKGLFPCAEGAGYAGGIISAAMDGENVASAVAGILPSDTSPA